MSQTTRSFTHDGLTRTYICYVPTGLSGPASLVICLHGGGTDAAVMPGATFFNYVADHVEDNNPPGFVVVYPYGTDIFDDGLWAWNDGRRLCDGSTPTVDDVGFLRAIPDDLASLIEIDPSRIYCCGISNGGHMTFRMAQQASDFVAAIGIVGACRRPDQLFDAPPVAVPIIAFHGTKDTFDPYAGGMLGVYGGFMHGASHIEDAIALWSFANGGNGAVTSTAKARGLWRMIYSPGNINFFKIINGGHTWPRYWQNPDYDPYPLGEIHQVHSSYAMWLFFNNYSL